MQLTCRVILSLLTYLVATACSEQDQASSWPTPDQETSLLEFQENTPAPPEGYEYWGLDTPRFWGIQHLVPTFSKALASSPDKFSALLSEHRFSTRQLYGVRARYFLTSEYNAPNKTSIEDRKAFFENTVTNYLRLAIETGHVNAEVAYLLGVAYLQGWPDTTPYSKVPAIIENQQMAHVWFTIATMKAGPDYFRSLDEQKAGTEAGTYINHWGKTRAEMIKAMSNEMTGPRPVVPEFKQYQNWLDQIYASQDIEEMQTVVEGLEKLNRKYFRTAGDALRWLEYMDLNRGYKPAKIQQLNKALHKDWRSDCMKTDNTCFLFFAGKEAFEFLMEASVLLLPEAEIAISCLLQEQKYPEIRADMANAWQEVKQIGLEHQKLAETYGIEIRPTYTLQHGRILNFSGKEHETAGPIIRRNEEKLKQVRESFFPDFYHWTVRNLPKCFPKSQEPASDEGNATTS